MSDRDTLDHDRLADAPSIALDEPEREVMDSEDRLRPEFVERVLDAVHDGDAETARELVAPLHPADVAEIGRAHV